MRLIDLLQSQILLYCDLLLSNSEETRVLLLWGTPGSEPPATASGLTEESLLAPEIYKKNCEGERSCHFHWWLIIFTIYIYFLC